VIEMIIFSVCAAIMYALTGAPSVGKTSIINELESQNENVIHEAATDWIASQNSLGNFDCWNDKDFIWNIFTLQLEREKPFLTKSGRVFIDRGLFDSYAFVKCRYLIGTEALFRMNSILDEIDLNQRYKAIFFILPYQENFSPTLNEIRHDDLQVGNEIESGLYAVYARHKHLILVPGNLTPKERAAFILQHVRDLEAKENIEQFCEKS
jgi:predicted ATPase